MRKHHCERNLLFLLISLALSSAELLSQVNVTTWHNDINRTGLNPQETVLNEGNVNRNQFGRICSSSVDGQVYPQPLLVSNVTINGQLYSSVVYVATENDSLYAFDGSSTGPTCTQLLFTNLLQPGEFPASCKYIGGKMCETINPQVGILGTPVIDTATNTIYLVSESQVGNPPTSWVHRLHALDITNFSEKFNGPVVIAGSVSTGLKFSSQKHIQRPGLLWLAGTGGGPNMVYLGFSLIDGAGAPLPNGWIFSYDAEDLAATGYPLVFSTTPQAGATGAGVWQGGTGLAAGIDSAGGNTYIYVGTADGTFDAASGGTDYGDSFLKLTTDLGTVAGYFTPFNQACMQSADTDFGSGGVMLIPDGIIPAHPYLAVATDKEGAIYVMDRGNPGGYGGNSNCTGTNSNLQTIAGLQHLHNAPAYWNKSLYVAAYGFPHVQPMNRYSISSTCSPGPICPTPVASTSVTFAAGVSPSISVDGSNTSTALAWAIWGNGTALPGGHAILYAFNPRNLFELYGSSQCGTEDLPGPGIKFTVPTVANGLVYIGTETDFDIYGELSQFRSCP